MDEFQTALGMGGRLSLAVKGFASSLGFSLCGIVPVAEPLHFGFFERWLGLGRGLEMGYLSRFVDRRRDPALLDSRRGELQSMVVVGFDYGMVAADPLLLSDPSRGLIARYAWMPDYHDFMRSALFELDGFIRSHSGRTWHARALVDSGPVLERDVALAAGIGFTGKNCCTIHPQLGSWLLLGTLTVPEVMVYDQAFFEGPGLELELALRGAPAGVRVGEWSVSCGSSADRARGTCAGCWRCLDACPTQAFVGPFHLDPGRCISYWTIESRSAIPLDLRPLFGNRIFGCDVCQAVCPWNRRFGVSGERMGAASVWPGRVAPLLLDGFGGDRIWLDEDAFMRSYARTSVLRAGRACMLRNVCVALGNWGHVDAVPGLALALADRDPLPRGHAAWALGRIGAAHGRDAVASLLLTALGAEPVEWVRGELAEAVFGLGLAL